MRKLMLSITILCITIVLNGCWSPSWHFDRSELIETVVSIEYMDYDNDISTIVEFEQDTKLIFDKDKVSNIRRLEDNEIENFLTELSKLHFLIENKSALEPARECLRLNLKNENCIILSCTQVGRAGYPIAAEFDKNGDFVKNIAFFGDGSRYETLICKYFHESGCECSK